MRNKDRETQRERPTDTQRQKDRERKRLEKQKQREAQTEFQRQAVGDRARWEELWKSALGNEKLLLRTEGDLLARGHTAIPGNRTKSPEHQRNPVPFPAHHFVTVSQLHSPKARSKALDGNSGKPLPHSRTKCCRKVAKPQTSKKPNRRIWRTQVYYAAGSPRRASA